MNNIDLILDTFTDKLFEINETVTQGGIEDMQIEKELMSSATTAVLKAVSHTRNIHLHNDSHQLQNLWMDAFAKSNEGCVQGFPSKLQKGVQNGNNFEYNHVYQNVIIHKLNDLEHVCLGLQTSLNESHKHRRMRFGYVL